MVEQEQNIDLNTLLDNDLLGERRYIKRKVMDELTQPISLWDDVEDARQHLTRRLWLRLINTDGATTLTSMDGFYALGLHRRTFAVLEELQQALEGSLQALEDSLSIKENHDG